MSRARQEERLPLQGAAEPAHLAALAQRERWRAARLAVLNREEIEAQSALERARAATARAAGETAALERIAERLRAKAKRAAERRASYE